MPERPESFADLMVRATGRPPYPYQRRLAEDGLPELLAVETGAGKTAGVLFAWLWRRRYHPDGAVRAATPRWLVLCEPMRTLTEQAAGVVSGWLAELGLGDHVLVHVAMGGHAEDQRQWRMHPERDAVVVGTVDMLLSRALNRGYGASRFSWPLDFALFNSGAHWIFDEIQLLGPALKTGRQLQGLRTAFGTAMPTSSTWMSATVDRGALSTVDNPYPGRPDQELCLGDDDRSDPALSVRLDATRQVRRVEVGGRRRPTALARAALELHDAAAARDGSGPLTLVVVNRVATAQAVFAALRKLGPRATVHLLHGRFRSADREAAAAAALAGPADEHAAGRIVVSTQVVEAGVDISATVLLTEAAPWPSMVQRAGRCNRDGKAVGAVMAWVPVSPRDALPYREADVGEAMAALDALEGAEVTASMLGQQPVPVTSPVQPVLRRADLLSLWDTAPDVSGNDVDVGPFIRDDDERDVLVAWRALDGRPSEDTALRPEELCKVPLGDDVLALARAAGWRFDHLGRGRGEWARLGSGDRLRPGQVVLVTAAAGGYDPERGWTPKSRATVPVLPAPEDDLLDAPDDNALQPVGDERSSQATAWVTLCKHLEDVEVAVRTLSEDMAPPGVTSEQLEAAAVAGRLHDIGKAHPVFQETLLGTAAEDDRGWVHDGAPWAKSGSPNAPHHQRRAFRHELASALALLGDGGVALRGVAEPDLVVYLVASHHGRVRLGVRSVPGMDDEGYVLGIGEADELPRIAVPGGETPPLRLSLDPVRMGRAPDGTPSWSERALRLLDELGPFRLAFLEALVRLADWRASAEEAATVATP